MLCSWEESGIDVETVYTYSTYKTNTASPYYVLTNTYPTTTKVVLPESVTSIGNYAFSNCTSLTSITIPDSVESIEYISFSGCTGLTSITIPDSVTSIGNGAFSGCISLTSITVSEGNTTYDSRNNCNAIIETSTNTLIAGCQNTVIPDSVTSIGNNAFNSCTDLTSITIPESVTSIGDYAFYKCTNLKEVNWESPIRPTKEMLKNIFKDCPNLEAINYHGTRIELNSKNIDDIIKDASVASPDEPVPSLDDIIKTAGEEI